MYSQVLLKVIIDQKIENLFDKTHIALFIYSQTIRNHIFWGELIEVFKSSNLEKFEMLIDLKESLSNTDKLMASILPFIRAKWSLYVTKDMKFPLSDSPVLFRPLHIYLPLAPDLLLELDMRKEVSEYQNCSHYQKIPLKSYIEFRKQTIENSSREIIFSKQGLLEKWQNSLIYRRHLEKIKNLPT